MKMHNILSAIMILLSFFAKGQDSEDLIRHCIQNYFTGTSYNYLEQIEDAFIPEATLYLENREGEMMVLGPDEYKGFFAKNVPGEFTGRYNKIISIDIVDNLALVKAEILTPRISRVYTDVFIVKEVEKGNWKIISKAANSKAIE